ncbi:helix-turn-helix domain-containing protein [Kordiimonas pumila]|uniref:Helix-turn-helix domain-containing protein n=1 Tax=Kordiimonas pumila TaxID=2161677 RepID=A0ABV7D535_9PROT|nr:helix-turn-helix transcriptional regulator [Kordiimonas pumila]
MSAIDETAKIDIYLGKKIRLMRISRGLRQKHVAEAIGVSFQQLQKYENGTNHIRANRLYALAVFFRVDPSYFFEGLEQEGESALPFEELLKKAETEKLIKYFNNAANDNVREKILNMVKIAAK